jgi:hypothetical protein
MSLKFTAMGRLPLLSTIGTRERAEDPLETLTVASGGAGPRGRLLRGVQLALSGGLCIFCIAASTAFLILSVSAP